MAISSQRKLDAFNEQLNKFSEYLLPTIFCRWKIRATKEVLIRKEMVLCFLLPHRELPALCCYISVIRIFFSTWGWLDTKTKPLLEPGVNRVMRFSYSTAYNFDIHHDEIIVRSHHNRNSLKNRFRVNVARIKMDHPSRKRIQGQRVDNSCLCPSS